MYKSLFQLVECILQRRYRDMFLVLLFIIIVYYRCIINAINIRYIVRTIYFSMYLLCTLKLFFFFFLYTNEFVPLMNKLFTRLFSRFRKFWLNLSSSFTMRHASRIMYARGVHESFRRLLTCPPDESYTWKDLRAYFA